MIIINKIKCESFVVTGIEYRTNKRFTLFYSGDYSGFQTVNHINLWNGSIWGVTKEGKRKLLKRVNN